MNEVSKNETMKGMGMTVAAAAEKNPQTFSSFLLTSVTVSSMLLSVGWEWVS